MNWSFSVSVSWEARPKALRKSRIVCFGMSGIAGIGDSRIGAGKGETFVMETSYELGSPISVESEPIVA